MLPPAGGSPLVRAQGHVGVCVGVGPDERFCIETHRQRPSWSHSMALCGAHARAAAHHPQEQRGERALLRRWGTRPEGTNRGRQYMSLTQIASTIPYVNAGSAKASWHAA